MSWGRRHPRARAPAASKCAKVKQGPTRGVRKGLQDISKLEAEQQELADLLCPVSSSCFVAGTPVHLAGVPRRMGAIETFRAGREFVVTFDGGDGGSLPAWLRDPSKLRLIQLHLPKPDGGRVEIELLRSLDWIEDYGAHVGGYVYLDMREMGAEGQAEVLAIEPCPEIRPNFGRLVISTFKHTAGVILDLKVASEPKPLGVTPPHPIWSEDRQQFVAAGKLRLGETVKILDGTTVVESIARRPEPEPVYNIEVEGDHVYRVGESGVLVHNASADRDEIQELADECRKACSSATRPSVVARLVLAGGTTVYRGASGFSGAVHRVVEQVYNNIQMSDRSLFHLRCAETEAISEALFDLQRNSGVEITTIAQARARLSGATLQTANVRGADNPEHGTAETPCKSCQWPVAVFEINYIPG